MALRFLARRHFRLSPSIPLRQAGLRAAVTAGLAFAPFLTVSTPRNAFLDALTQA